jgi:hypothetical protein
VAVAQDAWELVGPPPLSGKERNRMAPRQHFPASFVKLRQDGSTAMSDFLDDGESVVYSPLPTPGPDQAPPLVLPDLRAQIGALLDSASETEAVLASYLRSALVVFDADPPTSIEGGG